MSYPHAPQPSQHDDPLLLEVADYQERNHWRWVLKNSDGAFVADQAVALDPSEGPVQALEDLAGYLDLYAAPDRWLEDQTRLIKEVGRWANDHLLGSISSAILDYGTPVVVRVIVPAVADRLLYLPLEVAYVDGRPLRERGVTFVYEVIGEAPGVRLQPVAKTLRVLAVFSLPTNASPLALRREKHALKRLIAAIAATHQLQLELRVLQYGVTREALAAALEEGSGWDFCTSRATACRPVSCWRSRTAQPTTWVPANWCNSFTPHVDS